MGTRHLILIWYKGQWMLAQYGQWDGYPDGQGADILAYLKTPGNIERLMVALNPASPKIRIAEEKQLEELQRRPDLPLPESLSRDTGSRILDLITDADEPIPTVMELEFFFDQTFCEWAYVIDLDLQRLEVYCGGFSAEKYAPIDVGVNSKIDDLQEEYGEPAPILIGCHSFEELPLDSSGLIQDESIANEDEE